MIACLSGRPRTFQYARASLPAVSIESEPPPEVRKTFAASTGESAATRVASSSAGGFVKGPKVWYAASSRICWAAASAISARPWPTLQNQSPPVASMYSRPPSSQTTAPSPRTMVVACS